MERCYQDYPENTEPLLEIGRINHRNRDFVKARTYLKKFLSNPGVSDTSPEARFLLGDADYQLRDYAGAVEAVSALKSADLPERDGAQMLYELADSYREIGNASKAKEHLSTLARNYASTDWGTEAERLLKDVAWNEQHL